MNDIDAVLAGRIEDKWIEFVATEFDARRRNARRGFGARAAHGIGRTRIVEVHATYVWLLAIAVVAWVIA